MAERPRIIFQILEKNQAEGRCVCGCAQADYSICYEWGEALATDQYICSACAILVSLR